MYKEIVFILFCFEKSHIYHLSLYSKRVLQILFTSNTDIDN